MNKNQPRILSFALGAFMAAACSLITLAEETPGAFDIRDFGAVSDGQTKCTEAIRQAIDAAAAQGGGTVYVPAGEFLTGPIHLKSHTTLYLEAGALVKFSDDFDDYLPFVPSRWEGVEVMNFSPLIYANNAENIAIRGRGVLDGQGKAWWDYFHKVRSAPAGEPKSRWQKEHTRLNPGLNLTTTVALGTPLDFLRPPMIQPYQCENVLVEGVTIRNSPFWTLSPVYCDNVTIHAVTIRNPDEGPNTDGVNPDSCRDVRISNCDISAGDDCITIKSGRDADGRRVGRPAENYSIVNCTLANGHGGVVIGSEMSGGVRNITIANCVFDGTERGIRLKTVRGRGGVAENIRVSNIVMRGILREAIRLNMQYTRSEPEPVSERTPVLRNIRFSGITGDARVACELIGLGEQPIEGISFTDVHLQGETGFKIVDAKNILFHNVTVDTMEGPALRAERTSGLELNGFRTNAPHAQTPVIDLRDVKSVFVHGCAASPDTEIFAQIDAGSSTEVVMEGNHLREAKVTVK